MTTQQILDKYKVGDTVLIPAPVTKWAQNAGGIKPIGLNIFPFKGEIEAITCKTLSFMSGASKDVISARISGYGFSLKRLVDEHNVIHLTKSHNIGKTILNT